MQPEPSVLALLRRGIDGVDDALLLLLAGRRRLVGAAAGLKQRAGLPPRDPERELRVLARGLGLARRLGLPPELARGQLSLVIADAWRQQGLDGAQDEDEDAIDGVAMRPALAGPSGAASSEPRRRLLRWLPPPKRWAPVLARLPQAWQQRALEAAVARLLSAPLARGDLEFMRGRRLGISVPDLGLSWVLELQGDRLRASDEPAEATVRGSATDLLLLASRLEDADTLFFQRRLELTGDTELGLTARNLLDRLPWETVPLGARIALNRGARLARDARDAYRETA
ncbi:SCP2 sterol-binding domain-containing protein [bacterium BD-1]|uniref:ubiquinone anaerobic biosynthesis accessory factor UbiT n=1 Tax=Arenimonas sp. TaxID=1872635 RepID=UPI001E633741|nr:SCP2 sterol-binding domain-containing protein [Ottowia caeni]